MPSKITSKLIAEIHDNHVIIAYQGIFDNSVLTILAQNIENNVDTDERLKKKLFKIFLEMAQNVSLYSEERKMVGTSDMGEGIFIIKEYDDHFTIATGNLSPTAYAEMVIEHIDKINAMNREQLREYKRERRALPHGAKGGANIGLIQIALTSENKINCRIGENHGQNVFLALATRINK
jgi:hypothetical protein